MTIKPFLIDVDGVCIQWLPGFLAYMEQGGYKAAEADVVNHDLTHAFPGLSTEDIITRIRCFQQTTVYRHLDLMPGVGDGLEYLRKLFPRSAFIAVSACGMDSMTTSARSYQLRNLPFDCIFQLPVDASKRDVFSQFSEGVVVDDHPRHVGDALAIGHQGVLFDAPYNRTFTHYSERYHRAKGWSAIMEIFS